MKVIVGSATVATTEWLVGGEPDGEVVSVSALPVAVYVPVVPELSLVTVPLEVVRLWKSNL